MKRLATIVFILCVLAPCLVTNSYGFGNLTPEESYHMVVDNSNVYILDCRTEAEWMYVGHPGPNKLGEGDALLDKVLNIPNMIWKKGVFVVNESFVTDVEQVFEDKENITLIVMCRSGQRSLAASAALETAGYKNVYNMLTGFEGGKDDAGYRTKNSWKIDGLPYTYSGAGYRD